MKPDAIHPAGRTNLHSRIVSIQAYWQMACAALIWILTIRRLRRNASTLPLQVLGQAPVRFRRNSPRRLMLYRAAHGEPPKRSIVGANHATERACKIEILGKGQQFAAFGIHDSGAELEWLGEPPGLAAVVELPVVSEAQIGDFLARCAPVIGARNPKADGHDQEEHTLGEQQADQLRLAEAMAAIPNTGPADWECWNRVGMALFAATDGSDDGFALWIAWSSRHPSYDAEATRARWRHYRSSPPTKLGAGTLFHMAAEAATAWTAGASRSAGGGADDPWAEPHATTVEPEEIEPEPDEWPEPMVMAAFHGLIGELVAEVAPHTEADPHALLLQTLAFLGNKIGRGPHVRVGAAQHAANLYVMLAGATSRSRKGTSEAEIRALFAADAQDPWLLNCIQAGLSTGEGLVHAVRDERWGKNKKGELELLDEGVCDKRLLAVEPEFASVLAVMKREGNTLSPLLRMAWDRGSLQTMTRNSPLKATGSLISIVSHITVDELRAGVDRISLTNGLLNRFLFAAVRRSRLLPHGGNVNQDNLRQIGERLNESVRAAQLVSTVSMTAAAADMWATIYPELTTDHPGLFGSLIARAEAHTIRLALIYALADQKTIIEPAHLEAALAVWKYSEDSARVLFGDRIGDPVADTIVLALKDAGAAGMSRRDLIILFNRNVDAGRIQRALNLLSQQGRARGSRRIRPGTPGKPAEVWHFVRLARRP